MASDITEDFQIDITNESTSATPVLTNTSMTYDVAFNDIGFFDATTAEQPYRRQTAPYRKEQQDNSTEPGEQSLSGWWLRSQSSFHFGAGAKFYEPAQDQNLRFRFETSEGVNVWTPGEVELLRDVDVVPHPITDTNFATLRTISTGLLLHDGLDLDKVFDTITRTITNKALTSNVATLTTSVNHGYTAQMYVKVEGVGAPFDGEFTITSVTSNTFSYAVTSGNVTSTAATGTASVATVHFVDYATGSDPVYAVCDDGDYAYWITNVGTPKKWSIWRKPLTGDARSTADEVKLYEHNSAVAATVSVMEYVKDRLILTLNNKIYFADVASGSSSVTPTEIYTHNNTEFKWTSITESPSDIYLAGYENNRSVIHRIYHDGTFTNGFPDLVAALVVAEFPRGEIVYSIKAYLGYMVIGTSKGVRVAQLQDDGSLVYGPIIFTTEQPVYQIAVADRYAWVTNRIGGEAGLTRIDLGTQIEPLVFAYANDIQALGTDAEKNCMGVAFIADTNRLAFTTIGSGGKIYFENATRLRASGFITTGRIRFNTTEDKFFKYVKERALYTGGTIGISTGTAPIITVSGANGNTDIGIPESAAADYKQFVFTLNRDGSNNTVGPTLFGYQIKALPAIRRQRLIQYNLYCFDNEMDKFNNRIGYQGRAYERINLFESLEATSDIVTVQDFKTGETYSGLIEEVTFRGETAPHKHFSGFGGILTVTVRKL